jgi:ribosomal protein S18 acetylase RimI-like enzyme
MITLRNPLSTDFPFVEKLLIDNMIGYYHRHRLQFSKAVFGQAYAESENYIIEDGNERIGFLRLTTDKHSLHISDVQIVKWKQNAGVGSKVLEFVHNLAKYRGITMVTLNVFFDNPAANLYWRNGYRWIMSQDKSPIKKMMRVNYG